MHVDPSFRSASASAISAKRDFPSIRLYRVIHVSCTMYICIHLAYKASLASVRSCRDNISIGEEWSPAALE